MFRSFHADSCANPATCSAIPGFTKLPTPTMPSLARGTRSRIAPNEAHQEALTIAHHIQALEHRGVELMRPLA